MPTMERCVEGILYKEMFSRVEYYTQSIVSFSTTWAKTLGTWPRTESSQYFPFPVNRFWQYLQRFFLSLAFWCAMAFTGVQNY